MLAAVLLAFLATAGFFYVNIMAALVAGLVDGLGFSESEAGRVGSLNIYGAAFGALIAIAIVGRVRWRAFAVCALSDADDDRRGSRFSSRRRSR